MAFKLVDFSSFNEFNTTNVLMSDYDSFIRANAFINISIACDAFNDMVGDETLACTDPTFANLVNIAKDHFSVCSESNLNPVQQAIHRDVNDYLDKLPTTGDVIMLCNQTQKLVRGEVVTEYQFQFCTKE